MCRLTGLRPLYCCESDASIVPIRDAVAILDAAACCLSHETVYGLGADASNPQR